MKKITPNKKKYFLKQAEKGETLFPKQHRDGLVYVGLGPVNEYFTCEIFGTHGTGMRGDSVSVNYFIKRKDWNVLFRNDEQNSSSLVDVKQIQHLLEQAKTYIGKKVISTAGSNKGISFVVKGVYIGFDCKGCGVLTTKTFNEQGYFIWLTDRENVNVVNYQYGLAVIFTSDKSSFKIVDQIFVTNHKGERYEAIDKGTVWKFGCASIDKELIKDSYNFLKKQEKYKGDRTIKKVTIGAADFDLETLEKLVNYK